MIISVYTNHTNLDLIKIFGIFRLCLKQQIVPFFHHRKIRFARKSEYLQLLRLLN